MQQYTDNKSFEDCRKTSLKVPEWKSRIQTELETDTDADTDTDSHNNKERVVISKVNKEVKA